MNGHRRLVTSPIVLCALVCTLLCVLVAATTASAANYLPEPFSPLTGSGSDLSLHTPAGVAVDETTGNVFVEDGTSGEVVAILGGDGAHRLGSPRHFPYLGSLSVANQAAPHSTTRQAVPRKALSTSRTPCAPSSRCLPETPAPNNMK